MALEVIKRAPRVGDLVAYHDRPHRVIYRGRAGYRRINRTIYVIEPLSGGIGFTVNAPDVAVLSAAAAREAVA